MRQRFPFWAILLCILLSSRESSGQTTQPSYPDNVAGLTTQIKDMLAASAANDQGKLLALSRTMVLPDHKQWFTRIFGDTKGTQLNDEYESTMKNSDLNLARLFIALKEPLALNVAVTKVETSDDSNARIYQRFALDAMKEPVALYSVVVNKPGTTAKFEVWSIVYVDGAFRWVGHMQAVRK